MVRNATGKETPLMVTVTAAAIVVGKVLDRPASVRGWNPVHYAMRRPEPAQLGGVIGMMGLLLGTHLAGALPDRTAPRKRLEPATRIDPGLPSLVTDDVRRTVQSERPLGEGTGSTPADASATTGSPAEEHP